MFRDTPESIISWSIASSHGDDLAKNSEFIKRLSDDILNPKERLPKLGSGSPNKITTKQLANSLKNKDKYNFWKRFESEESLGDLMRARYLEALVEPEASIEVLKEVLNYRKRAYKFIKDANLDADDINTFKNSNIAYGSFTYKKLDGLTSEEIKFFSISGKEPTLSLNKKQISKFEDMVMPPKPPKDRFIPYTINERATDSETM